MTKLLRKTAMAVAMCAAFALASDGFMTLGARGAVGISGMRSVVPIWVEGTKMFPYPHVGGSLGLQVSLDFGSFSLDPGLQYTIYHQRDKILRLTGVSKSEASELVVLVHAIEIPVLARFDLPKNLYVEAGPQIGFSVNATQYKRFTTENGTNRDEDVEADNNVFMIGPTVGAGIKLGDNLLAGIRGHLELREYALDKGGFPWTVQAGVTYNFYNK